MIHLNNAGLVLSRRPLLKNITADFIPGELTAILGPNGAGKSTLLSLISGDRAPDSGTALWGDVSLHRLPARTLARRRAVMAQALSLDFPFTAAEVIDLGLLPWDGDPPHDLRDDLRNRLDLGRLWQRRYPALSGGERQRVQLARALVQLAGAGDGTALLLDEPTSALDPRHAHAVLGEARRTAAQGCIVIAVLHEVTLALAYADRILLLKDGEIIRHARPADLTAADFTAAYDVPFTLLPDGAGGRIAHIIPAAE